MRKRGVLRVLFIGNVLDLARVAAVSGHALVGIVEVAPRSLGARLHRLRAQLRHRRRSTLRRVTRSLGTAHLETAALDDERLLARVRGLAPDVVLCAGLGQRVPDSLLGLARLGGVNFHPSLLPALRGPDPLGWALLLGHRSSGVTFHRMIPRYDAGEILLQESFPILETDNRGMLHDRAFAMGARLLPALLDGLEAGRLEPRAQDEQAASVHRRPSRADLALDFTLDASRLHDRIRARCPEPGAELDVGGRKGIVRYSAVVAGEPPAAPGTVLEKRGDLLRVAAKGGTLLLGSGAGAFRIVHVGQRLGPWSCG